MVLHANRIVKPRLQKHILQPPMVDGRIGHPKIQERVFALIKMRTDTFPNRNEIPLLFTGCTKFNGKAH